MDTPTLFTAPLEPAAVRRLVREEAALEWYTKYVSVSVLPPIWHEVLVLGGF